MGRFLRPRSLVDALAALAAQPWRILAGGTDHFPARAVEAPDEDVLDITALPGLRRIEHRAGDVWIPCLATWTDLVETPLPPAFDGLVAAARQVGGVQIQNAGTIAGNLCNASPAADGAPCLLALDAEIVLARAGGRRTVSVADFLLGPRRTLRRRDELVLGIRIPEEGSPARSTFGKLGARRYLVISIVSVAVVARLGPGGRILRAAVAVGSCSATAVRLPALEAALVDAFPCAEVVRAEMLAPLAPIDDIRASAAYRDAAALELVRRAVAGLGHPVERAA